MVVERECPFCGTTLDGKIEEINHRAGCSQRPLNEILDGDDPDNSDGNETS